MGSVRDGISVVIIRVDADSRIGSGHAMRCAAIAQALCDLGAKAIFVVSHEESAVFMQDRGFEAVAVGGDARCFDEADAILLARSCSRFGGRSVLVDSYAAGPAFFRTLRCELGDGARIAYVDDLYTFHGGIAEKPSFLPVDVLLNYSFFAVPEDYEKAYEGTGTQLLLGPRYGLLRDEFAGKKAHAPEEALADILVTTGSTNPDGLLERLSKIVSDVAPENVTVHVVVGPKSEYRGPVEGVKLHRGVGQMSPLMGLCQAAVSAAGSTIYELCAMGVATLAVAMVDNQKKNMQAFADGGFGLGCDSHDSDEIIKHQVKTLIFNPALRSSFVSRCTDVVDAYGAARVATVLMG